MDLIGSLLIGLIAGALAGIFIRGRGFGLIGDIIIGLLGGFLGHLLFGLIGLSSVNPIGNILISFIGACILIGLSKTFKNS